MLCSTINEVCTYLYNCLEVPWLRHAKWNNMNIKLIKPQQTANSQSKHILVSDNLTYQIIHHQAHTHTKKSMLQPYKSISIFHGETKPLSLTKPREFISFIQKETNIVNHNATKLTHFFSRLFSICPVKLVSSCGPPGMRWATYVSPPRLTLKNAFTLGWFSCRPSLQTPTSFCEAP